MKEVLLIRGKLQRSTYQQSRVADESHEIIALGYSHGFFYRERTLSTTLDDRARGLGILLQT